MEKYIIKNGKKLRYGFTTGACAAGAAKAATNIFFNKEKINKIDIDTPKGWKLDLSLEEIEIHDGYVICAIKKDSGDDPDVTNGLKIYAKAEISEIEGISISGGIGIGKITKPGLSVPIGEYAINPVPRKMIYEEVKKVLPYGKGVNITIFSPLGVEIAKKTFNPKLGIVGGISIIGTTGIVEPMSEEAFKDSLSLEISVLRKQGVKKLIFSPGNYGRDFIRNIPLNENLLVKTSNFIGFMIDKAVEQKIEEILWVGHIGKMIKVAGGIFHTHSKMADCRMEILTANCSLLGAPHELIIKIMNSNTTEEAIEYIYEYKFEKVFDLIAKKISDKCEERARNNLKVGTIIFSQSTGELGKCPYAIKLLEEFKNE